MILPRKTFLFKCSWRAAHCAIVPKKFRRDLFSKKLFLFLRQNRRKKKFFGEEKFEKKPMLYLGLGICDLFFTGVFIMEKSDFELLPERRASNCGRVSPPRRVRKKTGSLFVVKPFSGGAHFRTVHEFSSYGRMKTLFARQAAFERWGSKNERD